MNITVDMMKRVNAGIASKKYLTMADIASGCSLDAAALEAAVESLDTEVKSMDMFFEAMSKYIALIGERLTMMSECYKAIRQLQIDNEIIFITDEDPDPAIVWRG